MLSTNTDKQPEKAQAKMELARILRHSAKTLLEEELEEVPYRKKASEKGDPRTKSGICPVCFGRLAKNRKGTRHRRACKHCGACLAPEILCSQCMTHRVWRGKSGIYCSGCGRPHPRFLASKMKHV